MLLYEYHVLVLISFSHVRRNKRSAPPLNNRYPNFLSSSSTTNWSNYNFICQKIFVPFLVAHRCQAHFTWSRKLLFTNTKLWRKSCCSWCCFPGQLLDKMLNISACTCRCRNNRTKYCTWKSTFIGTQLSHTFLSRFAASINYFLHLNWSFCRENKIHKYLQTQRM